MLRRQRLKLLRITIAAVAMLAVGVALLPAAHAAGSAQTATTKKQPTLKELQAAADAVEKRAAEARKTADADEVLAATAMANLRQAEATLAALRGTTAIRAAQAVAPVRQSNFAVTAAQTQLQLAQQNAQQEELSASLANLRPAAPGSLGTVPNVLGSTTTLQLQNARQAVATARRNLAAAQQSANEAALTTTFTPSIDSAGVRAADAAVQNARTLAASAQRAAKTAEINAETLSEQANKARAVANAAAKAAN
jgi:hypothetical protein